MKFRTLTADEVECRIGTVKEGSGVSLLLYKDARCDMAVLDETVGPENWQRTHEVVNGNLFCKVGIWRSQFNDWVWKQDVGVESRTEAEKGQASDAFKRACVNWGIGRELYTAPFIWIKGATKYDRFFVREMEVDDGKITKLIIGCCDKYGGRTDQNAFVFPCGHMKDAEAPQLISKSRAKALTKQLNDAGINIEKLLTQYKVDSVEKLTESQHMDIIRRLKDAGKRDTEGSGEAV